jgi:hypothetical protein
MIKLTKIEKNQVEKVVELTDYQVDVILTALGNLIQDYENVDYDFLADECARALAEARYIDRTIGELFV